MRRLAKAEADRFAKTEVDRIPRGVVVVHCQKVQLATIAPSLVGL